MDKLLIWNVRGLGTSMTQLKDIMSKFNPKKFWLFWEDDLLFEEVSVSRQHITEKVGGIPRQDLPKREFNDCISTCGLQDLQTEAMIFTCCNMQEGKGCIWEKLDRILVINSFLTQFEVACAKVLSRSSSDHCPLLVQFLAQQERYGPPPFYFQWIWVDHADFLPLVKENWEEPTRNSPLFKLGVKLKRLKPILRKWNKSGFGNIKCRILELEDKIVRLEDQVLNFGNVQDEKELIATRLELKDWIRREESFLAQKTKVKWIKEGDANTKFFHASIAKRRKKSWNYSMTLQDGSKLDSPQSVHDGAIDYFHELLTIENVIPEMELLNSLITLSISSEDNIRLSETPSREEVKPKVKVPSGFGDFRPISLCSVIYKCFTKVIVNRLPPLLRNFISNEQGAFIGGQSIFNYIALVQELFRSFTRKVEVGM
ncbi:uncharacterized protein LOC111406805 [Olea europaea var. sylvestris]|uniref:uncharacterized protein LOC111406805 n=1 Tax=Olea europaea var. sylvestris TaxID=158386 RepID=UPI000C1CE7F2|nr:uncharacterized protein LOC111406805 [Olea europaea var. sylvestris]